MLFGANGDVVVWQRTLEGHAAQAAMAYMSGGYTGARSDLRSLKHWTPGARSANADTIGDLPALRGRARDLQRNAPIATGAVNTVCTLTVGTGLWPHPRIDREVLGLTDEKADEIERRLARVFALWASRADLTRKQTFTGLQDLVLRSSLASGDVLVVRRFKERAGDLLGLKLQTVEADRVSNPNHQADTDRLVAGVALDEDGAALRYHVRNRHPGEFRWGGGTDAWTSWPAINPDTGDRWALLPFRRERPDQVRGVPFLAPVIELVKQLTRYSDAEIDAAVLAAFFTVFVKTVGGAGLGIPGAQLAPADAGNYELGRGAVVDLLPGEEIEIANPGRPNAQFDPFFVSMAKLIGVGIDLPFEILLKHFNASYSASRAAMLDAWRTVMTKRTWLVDEFCQPSYDWAIEEAVLRGFIDAPGFVEDPIARAAYLGAEWVGDSMGQIDPRSEVDAAKEKIVAGLSTLEKETVKLDGGSWEDNHRQQVKERRMRARDGLDIEPVAERIRTEPTRPEPQPGEPPAGQPAQNETDPNARIARERDERLTALSGPGPQPRGRR